VCRIRSAPKSNILATVRQPIIVDLGCSNSDQQDARKGIIPPRYLHVHKYTVCVRSGMYCGRGGRKGGVEAMIGAEVQRSQRCGRDVL